MLRLWPVCVVCGTQRDKSFHSERKLTVKPSPSYIHSLDCGLWDTHRERIQMLRLSPVCVVCGTPREKGFHCCWSLLYIAIPCSQAGSLCSHVILHERTAFYSMLLNIHRSGVLTVLAWLVPHETAAILACSVYTIQPCTTSHAKPHT